MPKKHHYVPVTYLRRFADPGGMLWVYRKDDPTRPFRQRPESTGFETHYYSQVSPEGLRDDSRLEALFSEMESPWPAIVEALGKRERAFSAASSIIPFLALMRVRGPAFRDAAELHLGNMIHVQARALNDAGRLPAPPKGFEDLVETMQITIDPQQSLVAMADALKTVGRLFDTLSYDVLHNESGIPFLTSDNPVIYFDPSIPERKMLPYTVRPPSGRVELLFPVAPQMVLRGRSKPCRRDVRHKDVSDARLVNRINRLISRFAYRTVFASWTGSARVIEENAAVSPVPRFYHAAARDGGYYSLGQFVFGGRSDKPKW